MGWCPGGLAAAALFAAQKEAAHLITW